MSEEQYKIEKGFIANQGMSYTATKATYEYLSKFKTYLIEQGEHVSAKAYNQQVKMYVDSKIQQAKSITMNNANLLDRIKELEKEVQQHRDNAFNVVSDEEIKEKACGITSFTNEKYQIFIEGAKWMQDKLTGKL